MASATGKHTHEIGNMFRVFIFPKAHGLPLSPAGPNRRQDNMFDTRLGYLVKNPLALWRFTFVSFTNAALNTARGQAALAEMAARNGTDLDGTPILKTSSEIDDLVAQGYVLLRQR